MSQSQSQSGILKRRRVSKAGDSGFRTGGLLPMGRGQVG